MESLTYISTPHEDTSSQYQLKQWGKETHFTNSPHSTAPNYETGPLPRVLSPTSSCLLKAWSGSWDGDYVSGKDNDGNIHILMRVHSYIC